MIIVENKKARENRYFIMYVVSFIVMLSSMGALVAIKPRQLWVIIDIFILIVSAIIMLYSLLKFDSL